MMIRHVICMDESGHFDPQDTKRSFIAGFIYTPYDGWSWEEEKKKLYEQMAQLVITRHYAHDYLITQYQTRLEKESNFFKRQVYENVLLYLQEHPEAWELPENLVKEVWGLKDKRCPTFGFPACLHSTFSDRSIYQEVVAKGMIEYIHRENELHPDSYRLFAVVKDELLYNQNPIADDNVAANLYQHMLTATIHNTVFSNPLLSNEPHQFRLELPTRQHVITRYHSSDKSIELADSRLQEMHALGFFPWRVDMPFGMTAPEDWKKQLKSNTLDWEKLYFYLPQEAALQEMLRSELINHPTIHIATEDIVISSINYNIRKNIQGAGQYLADTICFYFSTFICQNENIDTMFSNVMDDTGSIPLLLEYPKDSELMKGIDLSLRNKHLNDYMEYMFAQERKSCHENYFSYITENRAVDLFSVQSLDQVYLREELLFLASNYSQALVETEWIYHNALILGAFHGSPKTQFRYCNLLMRLYQHNGDARSAEFASACESLQGALSPIDKHQHQIQMISTYENVFDFKTALKMAKLVAKTCARVYKAHGEMFDLSYAKAIGKVAQNKAFLKKDAKKEFEQSLALIPPEDFVNRKITLSYILHYAIDRQDEKMFTKYALICFGETASTCKASQLLQWIQQFRDVTKDSNRFSLFVLVKACYVFYATKFDQQAWNELAVFITQIPIKCTVHPNEFIMKYQALIALSIEKNEVAKQVYSDLKMNLHSQTQALYLINCSCILELALHLENSEEQNELVRLIRQFIEQHVLYQEGLHSILKTTHPEDVLGYFTYMYK